MTSTIADLGLAMPLVAAPMAGGPTTPALVIAAAKAGGVGFLAGGYQSGQSLHTQIDAVRAETSTFGVNLFVPNPLPVDRAAYSLYREQLCADAEHLRAVLPEQPLEDDDAWQDKIDLLLDLSVPLISFTFGIPDARSLSALRKGGSVLVQTVTSADEARRAAAAGVAALVVQGPAAGGHSGTLTPTRALPVTPLPELLLEIRHAVHIPTIAAGGIVAPEHVAVAIRRGADAVAVGTALLLSPECGTSMAHRAALVDRSRGETVITHAFTGRPARGLRNRFIDRHGDNAPLGYPAVHHLTRPIRAAATAAGDAESVNLWAGVGYRDIGTAAAGETLRHLANGL